MRGKSSFGLTFWSLDIEQTVGPVKQSDWELRYTLSLDVQ